MYFRGKKLMILGGNAETGVLVETANSMGIYTIVVDPNPESPAKKKSSKSYNVDGMDVPGLVDVARKENVDGILVGVADILVESYQKICERLGFPCYASESIIRSLTRKDCFREICSEYGVKGIPIYNLDSNLNQEDLEKIKYPVMVKPIDNGGGVGMSICSNENELKNGIKLALKNSLKKIFMVERYMTCDDMLAYYTFKDGEAYLSAIADRITTKEQGKTSPVCIAATYPSKHVDEYFRNIHPNMCRLFKGIGIKNGVLNVQFFVEDGRFYAYDPGFRLQGEAPHLIINAVNGFDHRKMLINYALTGSMGIDDLSVRNDYLLKGKYAGSLWVLLKEGRIGKISGLIELENDPDVIFVMKRFQEGDFVTKSMVGTERQVLARIYVVCDSKDQYIDKIKKIEQRLDIRDESNVNMVLTLFNPELAWN
ncbi:MAG: hypothetical protein PVG39_16660 [Desulfobacteraceae bacterium]|jgi:biotin carboxylase